MLHLKLVLLVQINFIRFVLWYHVNKGTQGNLRELKGTQQKETRAPKGSQGGSQEKNFHQREQIFSEKRTKIFSKRNKSCQKIVTNAKFGGRGGEEKWRKNDQMAEKIERENVL